jgi:hypothetical protein
MMTRETKVGLVVAASFLCLVGIVVSSRLRRNADDAARAQAESAKVNSKLDEGPPNQKGTPPAAASPTAPGNQNAKPVQGLPVATPHNGAGGPPPMQPPNLNGQPQISPPSLPNSASLPPAPPVAVVQPNDGNISAEEAAAALHKKMLDDLRKQVTNNSAPDQVVPSLPPPPTFPIIATGPVFPDAMVHLARDAGWLPAANQVNPFEAPVAEAPAPRKKDDTELAAVGKPPALINTDVGKPSSDLPQSMPPPAAPPSAVPPVNIAAPIVQAPKPPQEITLTPMPTTELKP